MKFENSVEQFCKEKKFSGVATISKNGEQLLAKSYGYRNLSDKLLNKVDTAFGIASGTKTFTAVGIIKMIEQNFFDYSTTVHEVLDEDLSFIHPTATIKHVLCHTSGVYDYYDEEIITDFDNFEVEIPWFKLQTPSDYYPLFKSKKYKFEPGERYAYSNGGYILLGIIIEKFSGMKFRNFVSEKIMIPAKMHSTGFFAFNALPENTALGYLQTDNGILSNIYKLPIRGASDGGMYTNANDLDNFWNSLFSYKIIGKESLHEFTNQETTFKETAGYGMGVYTNIYNDQHCFSAMGQDAGVGFVSQYFPKTKTTINVLSNHTGGDIDVFNFIKDEGKEFIL